MSPLEKLIMKKKESGKLMDPLEQRAKMGNLENLRDEMSGMMKGDLDGAKVEVAAKNPEDLKHGLELAKKVLPGDESPEEEASESPSDEMSEHDADEEGAEHEGMDGLSPEEIDQLQMLLTKLKSSKIG